MTRTDSGSHPVKRKTKGTAESADIYAGKVLQALRQKHSMSQSQVAASLNLTFQQVQKYERGLNRMSIARLDALCRLFDVCPTVFLQNFAHSSLESLAGEKISLLDLNKEQKKLIILIESIPDDKQSAFYALVQKMGQILLPLETRKAKIT